MGQMVSSKVYSQALNLLGTSDTLLTTQYLVRADAVATVNAPYRQALKDLINGIVADGNDAYLGFLQVYAHQSSAHSVLNLVGGSGSTYTATINGTPTFTAGSGFSSMTWGSASPASGFNNVNTGYNFSTGLNWGQDDACVGSWSGDNAATFNPQWFSDDSNFGGNVVLNTRSPDAPDVTKFQCNDNATAAFVRSGGDGLFTVHRVGGDKLLYVDGALATTVARATVTPSNTNLIALGLLNRAMFAGSSSIDAAAMFSRLSTYMTAANGVNP